MLHQILPTFTLQMMNNPPVFRESVLRLLQTVVQDLETILSLSKYIHQVVHLIWKEQPPPAPPYTSHYMEGGFIQNAVFFQRLLEVSHINFPRK